MFLSRPITETSKKARTFLSIIRSLSSAKFSTENIVCCPSDDTIIPQITVQELVYSKIEQFYKFTATEDAITGKKYTFEQVRTKARNLSKALRKTLKLQKGDVVAIILSNTPEYFVSILGVLEAGLVITTSNPIYTKDEIFAQLNNSEAKAVITTPALYSTVRAASSAMKQHIPIICIKTKEGESLPLGGISFEELVDTKLDIADIEFGSTNDLAFLPYSSGTTGLPKGVELTHNNIVSMNAQATHPDYQMFDTPSDTFQDVIPGVLPSFHIYGFTVAIINPLVNGTKVVTVPRFHPDSFISIIKQHKITALYAAPPLALFVAQRDDVKSEYLKTLKFLTSGAAPLGSSDEDRLQNKIGKDIPILQGYGMTESCGIVASSASKTLMKSLKELRGSVGKPVPNTLFKIVGVNDPTGAPLGPNEQGEILVKGPQVMRGYFKRPEETQAALKNGWVRTGDIGLYDEKNLLFITDRLKELIKVKGFQVAPAELEGILREYPAVLEAAVVGVPHPVFGEAPKAYVVPKGNTPLVPEELQQFVAERVAKYKHLVGGIEIIDSIPKNPSGKILRRLLNKK